MSSETVPLKKTGVPVRGLVAEVIAGPSTGLHVTSDSSIAIGSAEGNDLRLEDRTVSRFHAEVARRGELILVSDRGSTNGTRIGSVLIESAACSVTPGSVLNLGSSQVRLGDGALVMVEPGPHELSGMVGRSSVMRRLFATVERVAPSEVPVLILGESGTGKELIGRALHERSPRAEGPLVTVDCGALSPSLFASELFGHERGAFTGAHRRHLGAFERAAGGTVFLDEVAELPPELQSALLGVLERKQLRRVGGSDDIRIDVRVISATSRDLRPQVNRDGFRLDLFYRLAGVVLSVPPLRERPEDIPPLVEHLVRDAGFAGDVTSLVDLEQFRRHSWPGNVRELRNSLLGALALGQAPDFTPAPSIGTDTESTLRAWLDALPLSYREARDIVTDTFERRYLERLLDATSGNVREAARRGSINRSYLMELLRKHGKR
jgi:DNA-binding NtrC family response regulator